MKVEKGITDVHTNEVRQNYAALTAAIRRGDSIRAIRLALPLLGQEQFRFWNFIKLSASSDISYTGHTTVLTVSALFDNWAIDHNPAYVAHAVLALCEAPKGTSAADKLY